MAEGIKPFHRNVKGPVETRRAMQHLRVKLGRKGGPGVPGEDGEQGPPGEDGEPGVQFGWNPVWPAIGDFSTHNASMWDMVLVGGRSAQVILPEITPKNDGGMVAVVTGNNLGQDAGSTSVHANFNGSTARTDKIERGTPLEGAALDLIRNGVFEDRFRSKVYVFAASFDASSWYVVGEWHRDRDLRN